MFTMQFDSDSGLTTYVVGGMFIPYAQCNSRWSSGNNKTILIGGDSGDVHAGYAINESFDRFSPDGEPETIPGVYLGGVEFKSLVRYHDEFDLITAIEDVITQSYDSIGSDTFNQTVKVG